MTDTQKTLQEQLSHPPEGFERLVGEYLRKLATIAHLEQSQGYSQFISLWFIKSEKKVVQDLQTRMLKVLEQESVIYTPEELKFYLQEQAKNKTSQPIRKAIEGLSKGKFKTVESAEKTFCERVQTGLEKAVQEF